MGRQISFIHEGVQYFTFDGSKFIRDSLKVNAATLAELSSKPSFAGEMRKLNNGSPRFAAEFPIVKDAVVEKRDNLFYVTGTVNLDGVVCNVSLDADGVHFEKTEEDTEPEVAVVEEQSVEEVTPVAEVPTEEIVDESVIEDEAEEVPAVEVPATEEVSEEPKKGVLPEGVTVEVGTQFPDKKSDTGAPEPQIKVTQEKTKPTQVKKGVGFTFGSSLRGAPMGICLGIPEETVGCIMRGPSTSPKMPRGAHLGKRGSAHRGAVNNGTRYVPQQQHVSPQPAQVVVQTQASVVQQQATEVARTIPPAVNLQKPSSDEQLGTWAQDTHIGDRKPAPPAGDVQELIGEIRKNNGLGPAQQSINPLSIVQEDKAEEDPDKDRDAKKRELRAKFSPEVNKVIGNIPHEMLGTIDEFTTNPVDVEELNSKGTFFCIDHRWHKTGNWFCIDVIPDKARYFYNPRLEVSMQIALTDLRAWSEVLK